MTALPPDLEALMPEPAAHRYRTFGHGPRWQLAGKAVPPDADPLFTADQVRAAILGATERAARICEQYATTLTNVGIRGSDTAEECAVAIRGDGGGA